MHICEILHGFFLFFFLIFNFFFKHFAFTLSITVSHYAFNRKWSNKIVDFPRFEPGSSTHMHFTFLHIFERSNCWRCHGFVVAHEYINCALHYSWCTHTQVWSSHTRYNHKLQCSFCVGKCFYFSSISPQINIQERSTSNVTLLSNNNSLEK